MATGYKSLKCDCCAGTLEYSREKKVWICQYCGNEIRREEEYDGLYTIKNVVKQTLLDIAYNRLENAAKNVVECEKIDSAYVGTIIAKLSLQMFQLIVPGACPQGTEKSVLSQMKRNYEMLCEIDSGISTQEEALYESFENADDAFGVLVLVFDSLGTTVHQQFVENILRAENIYSYWLNEKLLHYGIKNRKKDLVESILNNVKNIDCRQTLFYMLDVYEDGVNKREHIRSLVNQAELLPDDKQKIEHYLENTKDGINTKECIYCSAAECGVFVSVEYVEQYILREAEENLNLIERVVEKICEMKPNDGELYYILEQIYIVHLGKTALREMEIFEQSDLFIRLSAKTIITMLERADLEVEQKIELLEMAEKKEMSRKDNELILSSYLCENRDDVEMRLEIIKKLLEYVDILPTSVIEEYIVKCTTDGDKKPVVVEWIFSLDITIGFFRELLKDYLKDGRDDPEVRKRIIDILTKNGLSLDSSEIINLALEATEETTEETVTFVRKMISNGAKVRSDALSCYLEAGKYQTNLMSCLQLPESIISEKALNNYVLYAGEEHGTKAANALVFAEKQGGIFGASNCEIKYGGENIRCNLFQAYVILAPDSESTATYIINGMKNAKARLNPSMYVDGKPIKFKKYIQDNKGRLSEFTIKVCEDNKVFSLLF